MLNSNVMEQTYEGSVKTVYRDLKNTAVSYFSYSDDYSIFDWGKMPDKIAHKGRSLAILGGLFFQQLSQPQTWQRLSEAASLKLFDTGFLTHLFQSETYQTLCQNGMAHHFLGWVNSNGESLSGDQWGHEAEAPFLKVRSLEVKRPRRFTVDQQSLYHYEFMSQTCTTPFLIPLEVIFRFGMPEGSSLEKRLNQNPHYFAALGLSEPPQQNTWFERPVLEFFTKLEPTDRFLTVQEAFFISGLSEAQFTALYEQTLLLSLWLFDAFSQKGIELWDGKFEFAWSPEGLMLVDSIGPDELRLKYQGVHLSKEVIRQFYRDSNWEKAVRQAKTIALSQPGADWKAICREQLGETPAILAASEKMLVDNLYGTLLNHYAGMDLIATTMPFEAVVSALKQQPAGVR